MHRLLPCLIVAVLAGCGGPTRHVTFKVDAAGEPLRGAQVRVIALDAGTVPLPATSENLEEYMTAVAALGVTDATGRVKLTLHKNSPHMVEVIAPALGEMGGRGPWIWTLDMDGETLARMGDGPEAGSEEVGLVVTP